MLNKKIIEFGTNIIEFLSTLKDSLMNSNSYYNNDDTLTDFVFRYDSRRNMLKKV